MSSPQRRPPPGVHFRYVRQFIRGLGHFEQPIRAIKVSREFAAALKSEAPSGLDPAEIEGVRIEIEDDE